MSATYRYFQVVDKSTLRKVIINNPKKKNALNLDAYLELTDILRIAAEDDEIVMVAITGTGEFYSSGNDLSAMITHEDPEKALAASRPILENLIRAFFTFPKVLICVANGPCIGIAATTAILCDVIYASDTAYFYTPFSLLGLCAEGCASYTFPKILGKSKAAEMLLLSHRLHAQEALQFNFVSEVIPKRDIDGKLWPRIEQFAQLPRGSLGVTKQLMKKFEIADLEVALKVELDELFKRFSSQEFLDALVNFMSRRSKL